MIKESVVQDILNFHYLLQKKKTYPFEFICYFVIVCFKFSYFFSLNRLLYRLTIDFQIIIFLLTFSKIL